MTTIFRKPQLRVIVDGQEPPFVFDARATFGFDQDMGAAEFSHAHPMPGFIYEGSRVVLNMGDPSSPETSGGVIPRFTGYVETFSSQLYPGRHTAICKDVLWLASRAHPPQDLDLSTFTDTEAVQFLLQQIYPADMLDIQGLGLLLADAETVSFIITPEQTYLQGIRSIDEIGNGWRTFALADGRIVRRPVSIIPSTVPAWTFTEGVDITDGSSDTDSQDPLSSMTVVGTGGEFTFDENDPAWTEPNFWILQEPGWQRFLQLSQIAESMTFLSMQAQAAWIYTQLSKKIMRGSYTTYRDMLLQGDETVLVNSEHTEVNQNEWIQNAQVAMESNGRFSQTFSTISERQTPNRGVIRPFTINPTQPAGILVPTSPPTQTVPSASDVLASFTILSIVRQLVIRGGVDTYIYHVSCLDTSTSRSGTIVSRDWTASGPGCTITTGTGQYFVTVFTDLSTASITLDVADSGGFTGSVTRSLANPGVPIQVRKLYAGSDTQAKAFDGLVWRAYTPSNAANMTAVAEGPLFAAGDVAITTADDFQTAGVESQPFGPSPAVVSAVWNEPDVATGFAAGSFAGGTALSTNGSVWSVKTPPGGSPVRRIIISRFRAGEIHCITDTAYWRSDNYGSGWVVVQYGDFTDLQLAPARNILVSSSGQLLNANTLQPFTFPTLSPAVVVVAATAHIRQDKFYAIDDQGRTWHQFSQNPGAYAMEQGASIPAGSAQPRGIYRDGTAIDKIYCALGAGGLAASEDGFRTADGWELLLAGTTPWP